MIDAQIQVPYKTIVEFSTAEFIEKKSRFIGYIAHVETIDQAMSFIEKIKKEHYNATHNVFAYSLRNGQAYRYSDDGEPQGTAGMPVLDVIKKEGLIDVCIVATRYFGGIMLGGGGLVRAYSHTATIAVQSAQIVNMVWCAVISLKCDYSLYGKLTYIFPQHDIIVEKSDFSDIVSLELLLEKSKLQKFSKQVTEISNAQAEITILSEMHSPYP